MLRFRNTHDMTHILDLPRGVSCNEAELGLKELACELYEHFSQLSKPSFSVFLPSGTGTTAFFLNRHLQLLSRESGHSATTYGVSVAMKPEDLLRTIQDKYPDEPLGYPNFVHPTKTRIRFAKPHPSVKAIWCAMKRKGLLLDLIYGPVAWMYLLEKLPSIDENTNAVYYVHTGGLTGIESQLKRYESVACKA